MSRAYVCFTTTRSASRRKAPERSRGIKTPAWRVVYRARPEPRRWEDFARGIERHHREPGFGPFLSGLRVVRIGATSMIVVRDEQITVYREGGFERTRLPDAELIRFIAGDLGLAALPVEDAVATWRSLGEVCGDAPIPVIGSVVSRLSDLEASLRAMFGARPDAAWRVPTAALARLAERDAYYDLSIDRPVGFWSQEVLWLPRGGALTTAQSLVQMLAEVEHVPRGAAFSRPILASSERFAELTPSPLRGANAIFFDMASCIQHEYPSVTIAGIETRRSDMIGTALLAGTGAVVRGSGFSVLHHRPRDAPWPARDALLASLVADTVGAWLARRLDPHAAPHLAEGDPPFLAARFARLRAVANALAGVCARLRRLAGEAPPWAPSLDAVCAVADWALESYPGARDGVLPQELVEVVRSAARNDLVAAARRGTGDRAA